LAHHPDLLRFLVKVIEEGKAAILQASRHHLCGTEARGAEAEKHSAAAEEEGHSTSGQKHESSGGQRRSTSSEGQERKEMIR